MTAAREALFGLATALSRSGTLDVEAWHNALELAASRRDQRAVAEPLAGRAESDARVATLIRGYRFDSEDHRPSLTLIPGGKFDEPT